MKFKRVFFLNKQVLHAEQLNLFGESIAKYFLEVIKDKIYPGIFHIEFDNVLLGEGILSLKSLRILLGDFSFITYDSIESKYDLSFNLKEIKEELIKGKKFYIDLSEEVLEKENILLNGEEQKSSTGIVSNIFYEKPVIKITTKETKRSIAFCEIFFKNGSFLKSNYEGPLLNFNNSSLKKDLEEIIIKLKSLYLIEKDSIDSNNNSKDFFYISTLTFLKSISETIFELSFILQNQSSPFEVFKTLTKSIGTLAWMTKNATFYVPKFSYLNPTESIRSNILYLQEIIKNYDTSYEAIEITEKEEDILFDVPKNIKEIVIMIDPKNENTIHWIKNTFISSLIFKKEIMEKRVIGIERKIVEEEKNFLRVKLILDNQYFSSTKGQTIFIRKSCIFNRVSIYYEKEKIKK